jgi:hypothetical protein
MDFSIYKSREKEEEGTYQDPETGTKIDVRDHPAGHRLFHHFFNSS